MTGLELLAEVLGASASEAFEDLGEALNQIMRMVEQAFYPEGGEPDAGLADHPDQRVRAGGRVVSAGVGVLAHYPRRRNTRGIGARAPPGADRLIA